MNNNIINNLVWFIPIKKLRNAVREYMLMQFELNMKASSNIEVMINYMCLLKDKFELDDIPINTTFSPDYIYKRSLIKQYSKDNGCKIAVETGTYMGDTTDACKDYFEKFYTIELSNELYMKALDRFKDFNNVEVLYGDSCNVLLSIVPNLEKKALFWLDGHYSGGVTASGEKDTPIIEELNIILKSKDYGHVILIDDARCFQFKYKDYPTLEELEKFVKERKPNCSFNVRNDIIRIVL